MKPLRKGDVAGQPNVARSPAGQNRKYKELLLTEDDEKEGRRKKNSVMVTETACAFLVAS